LELVSSCSNAIDAMETLNNETIDLIFVDINMPRISGLDFVRSLSNPPIVIFTTAYSQHAATGFDLDAIDYLVKPIPFNRFLKAVNKANEINQARNKPQAVLNVMPLANKQTFIVLKVGYCTIKIELDDILYIEGVKDYVKVVVRGKSKSHLPRISMKVMMEKLPKGDFIRVHKSYIIALAAFDKIERDRVIIGKKYIPIGEFYRKDFYSLLDNI
jgi:two-component system, LytTR family, response regulator